MPYLTSDTADIMWCHMGSGTSPGNSIKQLIQLLYGRGSIRYHLVRQTLAMMLTLICSTFSFYGHNYIYNIECCRVVKYGRQRQLITRGLQVIRLIDNHGLSVQMLCYIAKLLQSKVTLYKYLCIIRDLTIFRIRKFFVRYYLFSFIHQQKCYHIKPCLFSGNVIQFLVLDLILASDQKVG